MITAELGIVNSSNANVVFGTAEIGTHSCRSIHGHFTLEINWRFANSNRNATNIHNNI